RRLHRGTFKFANHDCRHRSSDRCSRSNALQALQGLQGRFAHALSAQCAFPARAGSAPAGRTGARRHLDCHQLGVCPPRPLLHRILPTLRRTSLRHLETVQACAAKSKSTVNGIGCSPRGPKRTALGATAALRLTRVVARPASATAAFSTSRQAQLRICGRASSTGSRRSAAKRTANFTETGGSIGLKSQHPTLNLPPSASRATQQRERAHRPLLAGNLPVGEQLRRQTVIGRCKWNTRPAVLIATTPRRRQPVIVGSIGHGLQVRGTEACVSPLGERPCSPLPSVTAGTASSSAGSAKYRRSIVFC